MFTERPNKAEKDPKKILENLKQQEERLKQLEEKEDSSKVKEIKEKIAWKNVLQKAEGQKVKDDPILLKKTIKKMVRYFLFCNLFLTENWKIKAPPGR